MKKKLPNRCILFGVKLGAAIKPNLRYKHEDNKL
jgi:hypothetical protein